MTTTVGAVARGGDAFTVERLRVDAPRRDEVLVRFTAAGLCATDLEAAAGKLPTPRPVVLGHEGAGVVEAVGASVTGVEVGARVLVSLDSCGACRPCRRGQPAYCARHLQLNFGACRADGSVGLRDSAGQPVHDHFFGQSSFAGLGLAHPRALIPLDPDLPAHLAAPLGCGVVTGAGAVWNTLEVRPGASVAVFGLGTVGLSAVIAARVAGAGRILAVDPHQGRRELAATLGATDLVDPARCPAAEAVAGLTGGLGVDHSVEASGVAAVMDTAVAVMAPLGSAALLGVAGLETEVRVNAFELLKGRRVIGSVMGHQDPTVLVARVIELYRRDRFPLEALVTCFPLAKIDAAVAAARAGAVIKPVLLHEG